MKHLLLPSIIAMLAVPAFATSSLTCDVSGIGATTPNARMKASWSPTVYTIEWYDEDGTLLNVQNSAQTCTYDSNLTVPNTPPTKLGYTFIGWEKEEIAIISNPLVGLDYMEEMISNGYLNSSGQSKNANGYGLTNDQTWGATFSYGKLIGEAVCNATYPANLASMLEQYNAGTITDTDYATYLYGTNGAGISTSNVSPTNPSFNCWCRITGYIPNGGSLQTVSAPWIWLDGGTEYDPEEPSCLEGCVRGCAGSANSLLYIDQGNRFPIQE